MPAGEQRGQAPAATSSHPHCGVAAAGLWPRQVLAAAALCRQQQVLVAQLGQRGVDDLRSGGVLEEWCRRVSKGELGRLRRVQGSSSAGAALPLVASPLLAPPACPAPPTAATPTRRPRRRRRRWRFRKTRRAGGRQLAGGPRPLAAAPAPLAAAAPPPAPHPPGPPVPQRRAAPPAPAETPPLAPAAAAGCAALPSVCVESSAPWAPCCFRGAQRCRARCRCLLKDSCRAAEQR